MLLEIPSSLRQSIPRSSTMALHIDNTEIYRKISFDISYEIPLESLADKQSISRSTISILHTGNIEIHQDLLRHCDHENATRISSSSVQTFPHSMMTLQVLTQEPLSNVVMMMFAKAEQMSSSRT